MSQGQLALVAMLTLAVAWVGRYVFILISKKMQAEKARARLVAILEQSEDAILSTDLEGITMTWNPAAERLYGYSAVEAIGRPISMLMPVDRSHEMLGILDRIKSGGHLKNYETVRVRKDGKRLDVSVTVSAVKDRSGIITGVSTFVRDTSTRKQVEAESKLSAYLLDAANDSIYLHNRELEFLYVNEAAYQSRGYSKEEMMAMGLRPLLAPEYGDLIPERMEELFEKGQMTFESAHVRKDGTIMPVESRIRLVEIGGETLILNVCRDITERKRAENLLRESEEKYKNIVELAADMIYSADRDGSLVFMNEAGYALLDAGPEEVLGQSWLKWIHPEDRVASQAEFSEMVRRGVDIFGFENRVVTRTGSVINVINNVRLIRDGSGKISGVQGLTHDITERKRGEDELRRHMERLSALRNIDLIITSSLGVRATLKAFLDQVISQLRVDAADVLLFDPQSQMLAYATGRGFRTRSLQHTRLSLGKGHAGRAALERRIINVPDLAVDPGELTQAPQLAHELFIAYYGVPLLAKGQIQGVLEIFHRSPLTPDPEWLEFLEILAGQAAIALDNSTLFEKAQRANVELSVAYDATLEGWVRALDLRDRETEGHTRRVTETTLQLDLAFGLGETELVHVRRGALLHDIGKTGVPDSILLKPGSLTAEEWVVMRRHPVYAYDFLASIDFLRPALDIPYCHHERWDGAGYPRGLRGEEIPLTARIFAVVDVWDALRSDRPYRPGWPEDQVREHMRAQSGTHFDPRVAEAFLNLLGADGIGPQSRQTVTAGALRRPD
ncbi:MAG: PAS domain S-box protein [Dehalococcoidia bacterium]|nr:PAS domain S-box protein [Dehalococcoidia bacterium]